MTNIPSYAIIPAKAKRSCFRRLCLFCVKEESLMVTVTDVNNLKLDGMELIAGKSGLNRIVSDICYWQ